MAPTVVGVCGECGFDAEGLGPGDAAVAARSLARRWRELLDGVAAREDDGELLLRRRLDRGWSPLERAGHVTGVFEHTAEELLRVWEHEQPLLGEPGGDDAGRGLAVKRERGDLLAQLGAAAERLARVIERYEGPDWDRAGVRGDEPVSAWQLATDAIHEGSHHLRACRDELAAACAHPVDGEEDE